MGNIKPSYIKNVARELLKLHYKSFSTDFQHNKKLVMELLEGISIQMRNKIAGYITRIVRQKRKREAIPSVVVVAEEETVEATSATPTTTTTTTTATSTITAVTDKENKNNSDS